MSTSRDFRNGRGLSYVSMAGDAATDGADVIVGEVAADVAATQSAEIDRMRDLLAAL